MAYFAGLYVLLRADHHYLLGPAAAILGAVYLAEGLVVKRLAAAQVRFILLQVAQAMGLLTLAIPIQLSGVFIPMAWAAEAVVLFWLGLRLESRLPLVQPLRWGALPRPGKPGETPAAGYEPAAWPWAARPASAGPGAEPIGWLEVIRPPLAHLPRRAAWPPPLCEMPQAK